MLGTNGATEVKMLTPEQAAQLKNMMQPLVSQWKMSQGVIAGFLACAGIPVSTFSIDLDTGAVTLVQPMPAPVGEKQDAAVLQA